MAVKALDKNTFKTIQIGEITVLTENNVVFVPKDAYIVGRLHFYDSTNDVTSDNVLIINEKTKSEYLVKCCSKAVVYWSLDQKQEAENLLN